MTESTRLLEENKALLELALPFSGHGSLDSFIASAAISEAKRLINKEKVITLCKEDAIAFANALDGTASTDHNTLLLSEINKMTEKQKIIDFLLPLNQEELTEIVDNLAFSLLTEAQQRDNAPLLDKDGREITEINCDCQDAQIDYLLTHGYQLA